MVTAWLKSAGDAWNKVRGTTTWTWRSTDIQIGHFADLTRRLTRDTVANILQRETCRAVIACDVEDSDHILGFAIGEPSRSILHWAYVKHDFRGQGLCGSMLERLMGADARHVTLTFLPREFVALQSKYGLRFDPWAK